MPWYWYREKNLAVVKRKLAYADLDVLSVVRTNWGVSQSMAQSKNIEYRSTD